MSAVGPLWLATAVLLTQSDPALALAQSTRALRPVDAVFHVGAVRHAEAAAEAAAKAASSRVSFVSVSRDEPSVPSVSSSQPPAASRRAGACTY